MPYDRKHRLQDSMNGRLDQKMKREREDRMARGHKPKSKPAIVDPSTLPFLERWPTYNTWESKLQKCLTYPIQKYLLELRDYHDLNTRPQEAYHFIKRMWREKETPEMAAEKLKAKVGW